MNDRRHVAGLAVAAAGCVYAVIRCVGFAQLTDADVTTLEATVSAVQEIRHKEVVTGYLFDSDLKGTFLAVTDRHQEFPIDDLLSDWGANKSLPYRFVVTKATLRPPGTSALTLDAIKFTRVVGVSRGQRAYRTLGDHNAWQAGRRRIWGGVAVGLLVIVGWLAMRMRRRPAPSSV